MVSRLRAPTDSGPAGHGDTPLAACASRVVGRPRKSSPGERDLGVRAPETRYNTTTSSDTITGCAAFYQLITGSPTGGRTPA
jgi:hypothetical protein